MSTFKRDQVAHTRRMLRGGNDEPETRVGICCGDACRALALQLKTWWYAPLFKVQGYYRYRCDTCYQVETGTRHYLATDPAPVVQS